MDDIFRKTTTVFNVVSVARDTPRRYGKNGELLVNYLDPEDAAGMQERRRGSFVPGPAATEKVAGADRVEKQQSAAHKEDVNVDSGSASGSSSKL